MSNKTQFDHNLQKAKRQHRAERENKDELAERYFNIIIDKLKND